MPLAAGWLNVTFWLACRVWLPPLCAVLSVMLSPVELIPSVVPAVSAVQSIRPAPVNAAKPVVVDSVRPVMSVPAISVADPLAATEPCVATPPTVTVCARMKPLSAVTLILPVSPVMPNVVS